MSGFDYGPIDPPKPFGGTETRLYECSVANVQADGTADLAPVAGRAGKMGVRVPEWYSPSLGDRVLVADLNGDPLRPVVAGVLSASPGTPEIVLSSRGAGIVL